ncbi:hypothetical protein, partial [Pseudomonas aeruginosa]
VPAWLKQYGPVRALINSPLRSSPGGAKGTLILAISIPFWPPPPFCSDRALGRFPPPRANNLQGLSLLSFYSDDHHLHFGQ